MNEDGRAGFGDIKVVIGELFLFWVIRDRLALFYYLGIYRIDILIF